MWPNIWSVTISAQGDFRLAQFRFRQAASGRPWLPANSGRPRFLYNLYETIILVTTFLTWASIVGLSMTPNLVLGPSVAVGVGIAAHYSPWILLPVVTVASFFEGLVVG